MRPQNLIVIFLLLFFVSTSSLHGQERLTIAAASDLRYALDSIVDIFLDKQTVEVNITYGSSGKLTQQIIHGAPYDIFFSADIKYLSTLQQHNKAALEIVPLGKGRLVIWSRNDEVVVKGFKLLSDHRVSKIAIANPDHAPYGKRAQEALKFYGYLPILEQKIVYGENISQAAQFALSGNAEVGIVALSLVLSKEMRSNGKYFLIPEESHEPLVQGAAITTYGKGNPLSSTFLYFMKREEASAILQYFGFLTP